MKLNFTAISVKPKNVFRAIINSIQKKITLTMLLLITFAYAEAQMTMVKNGNTTSNNTFLLGTNSAKKIQLLYEPADLVGAVAGNITRVYFRFNSGSGTANYTNFNVRMGQTTNSGFNPTTTFYTGLTTLLSEPTYSITTTGLTGGSDWIEIPLTTPFNYNATQTLIVEIEFDGWSGTGISTRASASSPNKKLYSSTVGAVTGSTSATGWQDAGFTVVAPPANDAAITAITSPTSPSATNIHDVSVTLTNFGTSTLTSAIIDWSVNGDAQSQFNWNGSLATGASTNVILGSYNFSTLGYYDIVAVSSSPNGMTDGLPANDQSAITIKICNPLTGNYSINSTITTGGTNFSSFAHALDFLTSCGVSGAVTFNVVPGSGPYYEQVTIPAITGVNSANTITFNGNGETISYDPGGTGTPRATILLNNASYITVNNFIVNATNALYGYGIQLFSNQSGGFITNNNITNNIINISSTSTTANNNVGILSNGSLTVITTSTNSDLRNSVISNNMVNGGYHGIYLNNALTGSVGTGVVVNNNNVMDFYSYGIFLGTFNGALIHDNEISRPTRTTNTSIAMIRLEDDSRNVQIYKNKIHTPFGGNLTATQIFYGIYVGSNDDPAITSNDANIIHNNIIYNIQSGGWQYGMYESDNQHIKWYYNTVILDDTTLVTGAFGTNGYRANGSSSTTQSDYVDFRNNILYLTRNMGGTGKMHGMYLGTTASLNTSVYDNNVVYVNSVDTAFTLDFFGYNGSDRKTLADWQGSTFPSQDMNSSESDPVFVDLTNLASNLANAEPTNTQVNNIGFPVSVTHDWFNSVRSTSSPDPGIIEWTPQGKDASISWVTPPSGVATPGSYLITINISNTSTTTINSVNVTYTDGITLVTETFSSLGLTAGTNVDKTFTTPFILTDYSELQAYINTVNGSTDDQQFNDTTAVVMICSALSGSYTINQLAPVSSTNFTSFQAAADRLATCGISGNVTITVMNGPYNEQAVFTSIPGSGPSAIVTIQGNNQIISALTNTSNRHLIRLIDVSHFVLNNLNLNVDSNSTGGAMAVHIFNTASDVTISNNTINLNGSTSTLFGGIVASGSLTSILTAGSNFHNINITGNTVTSGGYGIAFYGTNNTGLVIDGNTIYDYSSNGIYTRGTNGAVYSNNMIHKTAGSLGGNAIQLASTDNLNGTVFNNHITHPQVIGGTFRGIYVLGGSGHKVYNNEVYDIRATGTIIGINTSGAGSGTEVFFNTVSLDHNMPATGNISGFTESSANTGTILRNNIFSVSQESSGSVTGMVFASTTNSMNSNYNVIYVPMGNVASRGTATFASLSDWQNSIYGADVNSHSANPFFESPVLVRPTNGAINNKGIGYGGITVDILGNSRLPDYDIGAYQFEPAPNDASISSYITTATACGTSLDVTFELTNAGSATLSSVDVSWTVNGASQPTVHWTGSLSSGMSTNVVLGTIPFNDNTLYTFSATSSNPNGFADPNTGNDTFTSETIRKGFSGSYSIDQSAPASAVNYTSFQSISDDLSKFGVCGPVTITVYNGPYTEQVMVKNIPGTSLINIVTFDGNGQTLQFTPTFSTKHIFQLTAANYVIVENLILTSISSTYGWGFHIVDGSSKIAVRNNTINVSLTESSATNSVGITMSAASSYLTGSIPSDSVEISGNTINGGGVGINVVGQNNARHTNIAVLNNFVKDFYAEGINFLGADNTLVQGNDISRPNRANSGTFYGIYYWNSASNYWINKNRIHSPVNPSMTGTINAQGIHVLGNSTFTSTGTISNNLISNFNNTGYQYGINANVSATSVANIYHNTVAFTDSTSTSASATNALFWSHSSASSVNLNVRNNIFNISRGGTGTKRLIDIVNSGNGSMINSDYNVFWFGTIEGTTQVARAATNLYPTLTDWQLTGKDLNSVYENPMFLDPVNANYQPTNPDASGTLMGSSIVGGIMDDINDVLRSASPAPGAFEWSAFCQAPPIAGTATLVTSPVCYGETATITISGNSIGLGLTMQWESSTDNINFNPVAGANTTSLTSDPLTETTYFRFAVTCDGVTEYSNTIAVEIFEINPVITSSQSIPLCEGESTTLSTQYLATHGFQFSWNGGLFNSESITVNLPGTYDVVVTSPNGCSSTMVTFEVKVSTIFADILEVIDASCFSGSDGSVEIDVLGALLEPDFTIYFGPFDYSMSGGAIQSSPLFTGLSAGTYTFTVHDPTTGCILNLPATVGDPTLLVASMQVNSNVSCNGLSDGSATVSASGGTGPYTVNWNTPIPKQGSLNDEIPAGTWTVLVTDANGCTATIEVTITEPDELIASVTTYENVSCNGGNDGSVTITATGGTTPYSGDGVHSGLSAGTHQFIVTDLNGCSDTVSVTITEPVPVTLNVVTTNVSCYGLADGTITADVPAGVNVTVNGQVPLAFYGPGVYEVIASVPNGAGTGFCIISAIVTITQPIEVTISSISTNVTCNGFANGTITASASLGATITVDGQPYNPSTSYGPGTYTVLATAANGNNDGYCTASTTVTITEPPVLTVSVVTTNSTYWNANNGTATATAGGGNAGYSYLWNTGSTSTNLSGLVPGNYTVTVTDSKGCTVSTTVIITEPGFTCSGSNTHIKWGQGGWGGTPNGTNPANYLYANFATYFPNGLTIGHPTGTPNGCNRSMKWTTAQAITAFLPSTSTPRQLNTGHSTNLTAAQYGNTFASQVVALTLNVVFDAKDPNFSPASTVTFGDMIVCINGNNKQFNGWTVKQLLAEGNRVLACGGNKNYISALSNAIDAVNNTNNATCCPSAPTVRVVIPDPIGQKLSLNVYPNPTNGLVNVLFETSEVINLSLTIMDLSGRILTSEVVRGEEGLNTHSLDLTGVAKGIYIIRLANENVSETLRLVVQ